MEQSLQGLIITKSLRSSTQNSLPPPLHSQIGWQWVTESTMRGSKAPIQKCRKKPRMKQVNSSQGYSVSRSGLFLNTISKSQKQGENEGKLWRRLGTEKHRESSENRKLAQNFLKSKSRKKNKQPNQEIRVAEPLSPEKIKTDCFMESKMGNLINEYMQSHAPRAKTQPTVTNLEFNVEPYDLKGLIPHVKKLKKDQISNRLTPYKRKMVEISQSKSLRRKIKQNLSSFTKSLNLQLFQSPLAADADHRRALIKTAEYSRRKSADRNRTVIF